MDERREAVDPDAPTEGVRVNDRRKIDPETGAVRPGARAEPRVDPPVAPPADGATGSGASSGPVDAAGPSAAEAKVAELTADLQRITAEYANYRKRIDRDREMMADLAMATVMSELLSALDDIERAREHDELTDGFRAVADSITGAVTKLGLERYGEAGEPFDPTIHEALAHSEGEDLSEPTCVEIFQPGYRFRGRVLRPARVIVKE